ncbi:MAG: hypothetical protein N5P05_002437 [Chroococcopsis gigantea SAG 12.99]|jgi:hypothetical protein|nr:hypothetical protein [Chroococcopsis gigantea SAG 12.99]
MVVSALKFDYQMKYKVQLAMLEKLLILTIFSLLIIPTCQPSRAAESAIIKYSIFRESISIQDLSKLSETGEVSPPLAAQLKMGNQNPEKFRQILNREIEIDPLVLSQFLNTSIGERLLDYISEVIQTPGKTASRQGLRGALVTSALNDRKIRLIEVLENYPTSEVVIDGDRLLELINQVDKVVKSLPRVSL